MLVTSLATLIAAQEPKPAFEVAAVRRNQTSASDWNQGPRPGGRFVATNAPLVSLVEYAYAVPNHRLENVPGWARTERFDVAAKAVKDVPTEQIQLMLRTLLEERFHLVIRIETRDMPISTLVLAEGGGRLGPNLVRVSPPDECEQVAAARRDASPGAMTVGGCGNISGIAGLAGQYMQTVVVDRTGLTGTFKFTMHYADLATTDNANLPSFVTALNEQLGLTLRPGRGRVDVLVIESVGRPSEN